MVRILYIIRCTIVVRLLGGRHLFPVESIDKDGRRWLTGENCKCGAYLIAVGE